MDQYQKIRLEKLEAWKERQLAYPGRFEKTHSTVQAKALPDETKDIKTAGRLMAMRVMGKLTFAQIQDDKGKLQIAFQQDHLGKDDYKFFTKKFDIGDFIGVEGSLFTTQKGEKTLQASKAMLLTKSIRPLPEKFHGLQDPELKARYRFLDLLMSEETRERFQTRNKIIKFLRKFLDDADFTEVDTPILQAISSGASARPFETHHNALDIPLFMRIAPETYLKRLVSGGLERVYELGKCFRNEGIDASHLQEFMMLEWYAAYWNYRDNMEFVQKLIQGMVKEVTGGTVIEYQGQKLDFGGQWPEVSYRDLVLEHTGIDLHKIETFEHLKSEIQSKNLEMPLEKYVGLGSLIDGLYKKYCRPHLIQPMFLTMHHHELVPLARRNDDNPNELDMFQVLVNGWEVVKAYSELVDPIEQKKRLLEQAELAKKGDDEAMMMEEDFILAMEYGMPPMSGLGLGVERIIALLTDSPNIRDVIYFPSLRPPKSSELED
ncbi:MAG: lysine--tRNA ligase [Halobacteriovoraceae bacterium]|nr:lysine--tRNA ligase [Halobacteriovoraceae bacterium]MCB9095507.1 lysine--tRNA ligase [Halobacteriovoraceae bacterium]